MGRFGQLPIKQIQMKSCQRLATTATPVDYFGSPLSSFVQETVATSGDQSYHTYAYRLDFLSKLPYACTGIGLEYPIVVYHDTDFVNLPLTLSNVDITDANNNPVTMLYSTPAQFPRSPLRLHKQQQQPCRCLLRTAHKLVVIRVNVCRPVITRLFPVCHKIKHSGGWSQR